MTRPGRGRGRGRSRGHERDRDHQEGRIRNNRSRKKKPTDGYAPNQPKGVQTRSMTRKASENQDRDPHDAPTSEEREASNRSRSSSGGSTVRFPLLPYGCSPTERSPKISFPPSKSNDSRKDGHNAPSRGRKTGSRHGSISIRSVSDDEDPGIVHLLNEISNTIALSDDNVLAQELIMCLLTSSPYWSEDSLRGIHHLRAPYLVIMLKNAGLMEIGGRTAQNALVDFYRQNTTEKGHKRRFSTSKSTVREKGPAKVKKEKTKNSSGFKTVNIDTDRVDHRGFPIKLQRRVRSDESPPHRPHSTPQAERLYQPEHHHPGVDDSDSSNSSEDFDPGPRDPLNCPRFRPTAEGAKSHGIMGHDGGDPNPSESSDEDSGDDRSIRSHMRGYERSTGRPTQRRKGPRNDNKDLTSMKLAFQFLSRNENKWSGPRDPTFTTEEYVRHFDYTMSLFGVSSRARIRILPLALKEDALDEFYHLGKNSDTLKKVHNASAVIRIISKKLETPEFIMMNKNLWSTLTLSDVRKTGDSTQRTFERLKKAAEWLQKILGKAYDSESMLSDFFRRALQDERFWAYVPDFDPDQSANELCGKIRNAILKQSRLDRTRRTPETMANTVEDRRWGKPNRKRSQKNPTKNGVTMTCTGCGSDEHLYRECSNPNKVEYREKKLKEIAKMRSGKQKTYLRSFFTQLDDESEDEATSDDAESSSEDTADEHDEDEYRNIASELDGKLEETMFVEVTDENMAEASTVYHECMNAQTRHVFFGSTLTNFGKPKPDNRRPERTSMRKLRYPENWFPGIMIDNGSTGSLCSVAQLKAYRNFTGNPTPIRRLKNHYVVSAHGGSKCIGVSTFKFPYCDTIIEFDAPIVEDTDTPLILGLNDQDRLQCRGADQRNNTIAFLKGPEIPLTRENGHLWLRWDFDTECLYTEKELTKLHYRFGHPGVRRMHEFLKRIKPNEVEKGTRAMLQEIQDRCKECQFMAPKPYVVKVSVPFEDVVFNSEVILDIMYIQGKSVLHLVDRATHFQAARFLDEDTVDCIWKAFMEMWVLSYLGTPDNLRHDQGTQFVSPRFQALAAEAGITCRPVGIEAPNAMSVGERYHAPLRKTFLKLQESYGMDPLGKNVHTVTTTPAGKRKRTTKKVYRPTGVDDEYLLAISVMCINSTIGPEGICPTLLVFGAMPKIPLPGSKPSAVSQGERMMMMETARDEYLNIVGKMRLQQAEKAFVPSSPPTTLKYGEKVLVYRDITNRWEPRIFVSRNDHNILVYEPNGDINPYAISRVSEFKEGTYLPRPDLFGLTPDEGKSTEEPTASSPENDGLPEDLRKDIEDLEKEDGHDPVIQVDVSTGNPIRPRQDQFDDLNLDEITFMEQGDPDDDCRIFESNYTVVVKNNAEHLGEFKAAITEEVNGLQERGTFKEVKRSEFSPEELKKMLIIKAKLLLSIKEPGEPEERKKARIVAQAIGKKDRDKCMLMTYSPTVGKGSVRLMLSIAGGKKQTVFLRDISQAYISSKKKLLRKVYLIPPKELNLDPDILWLVLRPLYGLPESGVYWFETYISHHHDVLKMSSTEMDPCLLYRHDTAGELDGIVCLQVDDSIGAGTPKFLRQEEEASKVFKSKGQVILKDGMELKFNGQHVKRSGNVVTLQQQSYVDRMPTEKIERSPESFMSHRGQAAYVSTCTRPDVSCAVNQLSQVKATEATDEDFKRMDDIFKRLKNSRFELRFGNVDLRTAEVQVFADASFANNRDLSSQLGYVILLVDASGHCSVLSWSSVKCKRVTRSVLAAELYALAHGFDAGFALSHTVGRLIGRKVTVRVFTDSRTLFDSVVSLCSMTEKRLLIDIYSLRQSYRTGDLAKLGWIRTQHNIADALTKDMKSSALHDVLRTHRINTPVEQWVDQGPIPERDA